MADLEAIKIKRANAKRLFTCSVTKLRAHINTHPDKQSVSNQIETLKTQYDNVVMAHTECMEMGEGDTSYLDKIHADFNEVFTVASQITNDVGEIRHSLQRGMSRLSATLSNIERCSLK